MNKKIHGRDGQKLDFTEVYVTKWKRMIQPREQDEARFRKAIGDLSSRYDELCDVWNATFEGGHLLYPSEAGFIEKIRSTGEKGSAREIWTEAMEDLALWQDEISRLERAAAVDKCLVCMSVNMIAETRNISHARVTALLAGAIGKWARVRHSRIVSPRKTVPHGAGVYGDEELKIMDEDYYRGIDT